MSGIHCDKSIDLLRQKLKAADASLQDALTLVETVSAQQKNINSLNQKLKDSEQKILMIEERLDQSVHARTMQGKEIQMLQDKLKGSKDECQRLKDLNFVERQKAREFEKLKIDLESSRNEIMKYMEYKDLKIQHLENDAKQHEQKIEKLEQVLDKQEMSELRIEPENSQVNLSGIKCDLPQCSKLLKRLPDNNPNIHDLSDLNRPLNLAEKHEELYDNEWTFAFEFLVTLDAYRGDSERKVIAALLAMLTTAYKMTREKAGSQLEALHHVLSDFHGWTTLHGDTQVQDVMKQQKDERKKVRWLRPNKDLTEKYRKEIEKAFPKLNSSDFESEALKAYLRTCLELCWLMAIQDPPIHLKCDPCENGELFDESTLKFYTKAGPIVQYIVWPPLFLEKDGALLCKGVAQGDKRLSCFLHKPQEKNVHEESVKSDSLRAHGALPLATFSARDDIRVERSPKCFSRKTKLTDRF